ncbi:MAG: amino acid-binding protein [Betaproteobacteria bacterium RIFCSPLOWO2_02_FULL_65_24]|nr:MAG: amino acid-binding protein [Betaproteobacteria bacterium RIFCSPLOWO2_02_FULL_65_24]OGA81954.1 MAG: amino acid-binding protein [Betaproteobacteria bacterium RIFCSPLOWO2_12_FULL_66_14]
MAIEVSRAEVWAATIDDRVGATSEKLDALAKAGANFEFLLARRSPEEPGKGLLFVAPVKGAKLMRAAREAGFERSDEIHSLRIEGPDKAGVIASVTRALTDAGISFRGLSAAAVGRRFVAHLAVDSADDAKKATSALKKLR